MKSLYLCISFSIIYFSGNQVFSQILINEFVASNYSGLKDEIYDEYSDWIEIYNNSGQAVNLNGYSITDNLSRPRKWVFPYDYILEPDSYFIIWADGNNYLNHTSFALSKDGEEIGIFNAMGVLLDSVTFGPQVVDVSMGRNPDDFSQWGFYEVPTPGKINSGKISSGVSPEVKFSLEGGVYDSPLLVSLNVPDGFHDSIYYTTDGSEPSIFSGLYTGPLLVDSTKVLKARSIRSGAIPSETETQTYFVSSLSHQLPIVSFSADPSYLFDDSIGIYVVGKNGITGYCNNLVKRNYCQDWEHAAYAEYFNIPGEKVFSANLGVKIHGNCSRNFPQKSLALFARRRYGDANFKHTFFTDKPITQFEALVLRNSGNDNGKSMIRDGLMSLIAREVGNIDYQAYQPVALYINGQYWGLYNLRERLNEHYVADNHNVEPDQIDMLEDLDSLKHGDKEHITTTLNYFQENDLSDSAKYQHISDLIDVKEFINYLIAEIYCANTDWPSNNVKYWRPRHQEGKWRWILYDTDFGFGLQGEGYTTDMFHLLKENGLNNNIINSNTAFFFNELVRSPYFRKDFLESFFYQLNTVYSSPSILAIIDDAAQAIAPEISNHSLRWGLSVASWNDEIEKIKEFAKLRPDYLIQHLVHFLEDYDLHKVSLQTNPIEDGVLTINEIEYPKNLFKAYFETGHSFDIGIKETQENTFIHWMVNGNVYSTEESISITIEDETEIFAVFEIPTLIHVIEGSQFMELFPNPASDRLNIRLNGDIPDRPMLLKIMQLDGSVVYSENITEANREGDIISLDISSLFPSLYVISLSDREKAFIGKFITR